MPNVMIRRTDDGKLSFYIAKKDQEDTVAAAEFDAPERWGGEVELTDGSKYYVEPMELEKLPITVRAKRL